MMRGATICTVMVVTLVAGCKDTHDVPLPPDAYIVEDDAITGLSGLVHSLDQDGLLWAVNDNDVMPRLFRLGTQGEALGRVRVRGALLFNNESIALWDPEGEAHDWILIGDIGDNRGIRRRVHVYGVVEPAPGEDSGEIAWRLSFQYPGGARDAEAMTVDHWHDDLLVISKRDRPAKLFSVPLAAREQPGAAMASFETTLPDAVAGRVTGMSLSRDGRLLAVLTYDSVYLWQRAPGDDWAAVMSAVPERIELPELAKAEGITLEPVPGGNIFVGSEKYPAVLLPVTRD